ncbi:hypothetical protein [Bradyrhizobium sp. ORS 86]|uniref:hypothetical protein n=1 Tax=Bradyrhizobium sp. ORS 86 TaxID=1685970 RepID=UPI00388DC651
MWLDIPFADLEGALPPNQFGKAPSDLGRGDIPERETHWLIQRRGLYATSRGCRPGWSPDPWRAQRYATARDADNARLLVSIDDFRDDSTVVEHVFINKMPRTTADSTA